MATFTSEQAAAGFPRRRLPHGEVGGVYGKYDIGATAPAENDVYELLWIPAGATVVGGFFQASDIDEGGAEQFNMDIGTSSDPDMFGNYSIITGDAGSVKPEVGIWFPFGGQLFAAGAGPVTFTEDTKLQAICNAAASDYKANSVMHMVAWYTFLMTVS